MKKYDICIVLGHMLGENGSLSQQTKERTDLGINKYKKGICNKVLFSGNYEKLYGIGIAEAMKEYALETGIQNEDVLIENFSLETVGQILFSKLGVLDARGYKKSFDNIGQLKNS
jgi:vancomycin permeability regulator SanA